eukprot:3896322-Pyramimonas_sp.AAC.1
MAYVMVTANPDTRPLKAPRIPIRRWSYLPIELTCAGTAGCLGRSAGLTADQLANKAEIPDLIRIGGDVVLE